MARLRGRHFVVTAVALALLGGCSVREQDAHEILDDAAEQAKSVARIRYDFAYRGHGDQADAAAPMQGTVWLESLEENRRSRAAMSVTGAPARHRLRVEATVNPVDPQVDPYDLIVVRTDDTVYQLDQRTGALRYASLYTSGAVLQSPILPALMEVFAIQPEPLGDEIRASESELILVGN